MLKDFSAEDRKALPVLLEDAADAVALVVDEGAPAAQNRVNQRS